MLDKTQRKIILTSTIGTVIEWAEYAFYGYLATTISHHFFPTIDQRAGIVAALAIFAAGFIMRPIGAVIFGHIGDCIGRKKSLLLSMLLMGIATCGIGFLPTYTHIGIWAPILLLICRMLQGLAVASECFSAAIFLIEHDKTRFPYLAGSWPGMAAALGMSLGGLAATLVHQATTIDWAWRIPFFIGALGCFLALYLRQKIEETPIFMQAKSQKQLVKYPIVTLLKGHWTPILKTFILAIFVGSVVYICNLYFTTYLIQQGHFANSDASLITTIGELLVVASFPVCALLADRFNGLLVMKVGLIGFALFSPMLFKFGASGDFNQALFAQIIYAFCNSLATAPMFKWLYDQFPTEVRVTGITVSWNVAIALFGGTAPLMAHYSVDHLNLIFAPGVYISLCALLTLFIIQIQQVDKEDSFDAELTPSVSYD